MRQAWTSVSAEDPFVKAGTGRRVFRVSDRIAWAALPDSMQGDGRGGKTRAKHADIVLVHGGGPGVEKVAARWAERSGVDQIVCKPDWEKHGRAAPFRRNDELLNLLPKGVIAFPGNGITDNLVDKAIKLGIPVHRVSPKST